MINRFLEQQTAIYAALEDLKKDGHAENIQHLEHSEVKSLRELSSLLAPFKLVTQTHSSDSECTVSSVHPLMHKLLEQLKAAPITCNAIKPAREAMIANLQTRYNDEASDVMLQEACILDPRFKSAPHISAAEKRYLATHIVSHSMSLHECMTNASSDSEVIDVDVDSPVVEVDADPGSE
jgi:hypothetical protein